MQLTPRPSVARRLNQLSRLGLAAMLVAGLALPASGLAQSAPVTTTTSGVDQQGQPTQTTTTTTTLSTGKKHKKERVAKEDKVQQTKATKAEVKREKKVDPLIARDSQLPDKQLYDKALAQQKSGHFDVARLDLQTLLNTYPDSQYLMRAKLAVADSWYREGGTAALTQAEQEYGDFITFFPNAPEAAEAQMRIGDIYLKQMDTPDRDYTKATKAEDAYRTMLKQYPDAPASVTKEAKQKLREVQEVLATRESDLAEFYGTHANWPAAIARYDTVIETYPLYSHMDDALIGLGDAYEAEAAIVRSQRLPEAARAKLLQEFDGKAADAYRRVVLYHYAAPHVEDAKERLAAMNLPIPQPTPEEVAASEALEGSRAQYDLRRRLELLFLHSPDTVNAARIGQPPLEDPTPVVAPTIVKELTASYREALDPAAAAAAAHTAAPHSAPADTTPGATAPAPPSTTGAPTLEDVPVAGSTAPAGDTSTVTEAQPASSGGSGSGASLGVDVLTPGVATGSGAASSLPAATGKPDPNNGLPTVAPKNNAALPPIEKPAEAPDQVNDVPANSGQPAAQVANGKKKPKAPAVNKTDESSSKKKPKKGLDKLNPF